MFAPYPYLTGYLLKALDATPSLIETALHNLSESVIDNRPDPDRFTIREAIAHLADFEPIFRGRMERMASEDVPTLENRDEEQMAIDNDYAHADLNAQLRLFAAERNKTVTFLTNISTNQWSREGHRENVGNITIEDIAHLLVVHDVYHLKQVVDYSKLRG